MPKPNPKYKVDKGITDVLGEGIDLPYKDEKEKRAYLESQTELYKGMGYTPDQIKDIINEKMADEKADANFNKAHAVTDMVRNTLSLAEKYEKFGSPYVEGDLFTRVTRALYKPETSVENIEYNEMIARKRLTREGCIEILQEATALLTNADPKIFTTTLEDPNEFAQHYNEYTMGWVASSLQGTIASFRNRFGLTELDIPSELEQKLKDNRLLYENGGTLLGVLAQKADILNIVLPENVTTDQLSGGLSAAKDKVIRQKLATYITEIFNKNDAKESNLDLKDFQKKEDSPAVTAFYQRLQKRMRIEQTDYARAAKIAEQRDTNKDYLKYPRILAVKSSATDTSVQEKNQKLMDDRFKALHTKMAGDLTKYEEDPMYALDEVAKALDKGHMMFRREEKNANYAAMVTSVKNLKELEAKGFPNQEAIDTYELELTKLSKAAEQYLETKYKDNRTYSNTALDRIDAAKMCTMFAVDKLRQLRVKENHINKTELAKDKTGLDLDHEYTKAEILEECKNALMEYQAKPSLEKYSEINAYRKLYVEMNRPANKGMTKTGNAIQNDITKNTKLFGNLMKNDPDFAKAITSGKAFDADEMLKKAVDAPVTRARSNAVHMQKEKAMETPSLNVPQ